MHIFKKAPINIPVLLRIIGWLLMIEATFMIFPLLVALAYCEKDVISFIYSAAITFVSGLLLTTTARPKNTDMGKRDGFFLTAIVWIIFAAFAMLPFLFYDSSMTVTNAFFECISGFTTTGATILKNINELPHGILLWRSMTQWIGGMGIILFTLAVLPMLNSKGGIQLFNAEVTGITHDKLRPRISQTAKGLWLVYIISTITEIILLWIGPMDLYESVCQSFCTISTGGFSTQQDSIGYWNSTYVNHVIIAFMFLGGINFSLLYKVGTGDYKSLWKSEPFRWYIWIIITVMVIMFVGLGLSGTWMGYTDIVNKQVFQIVSVLTSTGFLTTNYEDWGPFFVALLMLLMVFGSCAGSTTGGAKIDRLIILVKNIKNEFYRALHPNSIVSVRFNEKSVPYEIVAKTIAFLSIYVIIIVFGGMLLTALGMPLIDAFGSTLSCMSNIGVGFGVTGPLGSFDNIPEMGKWVMSLMMLIGRLELFTVLIVFSPYFWKK